MVEGGSARGKVELGSRTGPAIFQRVRTVVAVALDSPEVENNVQSGEKLEPMYMNISMERHCV